MTGTAIRMAVAVRVAISMVIPVIVAMVPSAGSNTKDLSHDAF
jgi:hypothetical protein